MCLPPCTAMGHEEGRLSTTCLAHMLYCFYTGFCWQPKARRDAWELAPDNYELDNSYPHPRNTFASE